MMNATEQEACAAYEKGRMAGADFVTLARKTEEDGTVEEQTLIVFCPLGNSERRHFEKLAADGIAICCTPEENSEEVRRDRGSAAKRGGPEHEHS